MSTSTRAVHEGLPRTRGVRPPPTSALRCFAGVSRTLIRSRYRVEVHGAEHFPAYGPVVVAANHTGFADGPLMTIFAPRPLHALTKREMFTSRALGGFLVWSGLIPVHRELVDPEAIKVALRVLRDGGAVGIFPEGTRGAGEMLQALGGVSYLALVSGAPVLPLVFLGTRAPGGTMNSVPPSGARMVMQYGPPVHLGQQPWPRHPHDVRRGAEQVRASIASLLEQAKARTGMTTPGPVPDPQTKEEL